MCDPQGRPEICSADLETYISLGLRFQEKDVGLPRLQKLLTQEEPNCGSPWATTLSQLSSAPLPGDRVGGRARGGATPFGSPARPLWRARARRHLARAPPDGGGGCGQPRRRRRARSRPLAPVRAPARAEKTVAAAAAAAAPAAVRGEGREGRVVGGNGRGATAAAAGPGA